MSLFLNLHAIAAKRGDGLRPELRALFERLTTSPGDHGTARSNGGVQSGPDPATSKAAASCDSGSLIHGRVEPRARPAMSDVPPKPEVNQRYPASGEA
jgi:hypothetical protein